jgi:hypothetical protein
LRLILNLQELRLTRIPLSASWNEILIRVMFIKGLKTSLMDIRQQKLARC